VHIHRVDQNKSASKQFGKSIHRRSQGISKTFRALIYKAHRAVIFATAQLSCHTDEIGGPVGQRVCTEQISNRNLKVL